MLLMCRQVTTTASSASVEERPKPKVVEQSLANLSSDPEVFLQTLQVKLVNGQQERTVRAIIDTGSHRSYILGRVAESLGYDVEERRTMVHSLFGGSQTHP